MNCKLGGTSRVALRTLRSQGLGNIAIPWAKALVGSAALGIRYREPWWSLSKRGYGRFLRAPYISTIPIVESRRFVHVTEDDYLSTGEVSYNLALRKLRAAGQIPASGGYTLIHEGMWGGYLAIEEALPYIRSRLIAAAVDLRPEILASFFRPRKRPLAALHVRLGDFRTAERGPGPGQFNQSLPLGWYENIVSQLLTSHFNVAVLTDDVRGCQEQSKLLGQFVVDSTNPVADIAVMFASDLLVCSVSSMSLLAAACGSQPYIWFEPNLNAAGGWRSLWGHQVGNGAFQTAASIRQESTMVHGQSRSVPMGYGNIPDRVFREVELGRQRLRRSDDLAFFGVVRRQ